MQYSWSEQRAESVYTPSMVISVDMMTVAYSVACAGPRCSCLSKSAQLTLLFTGIGSRSMGKASLRDSEEGPSIELGKEVCYRSSSESINPTDKKYEDKH